ncbi:hypothetical protein DE170_000528 [Clostridium acetobutylicum]|nr:hypothetical protein [Clostridium acetobutylicum]
MKQAIANIGKSNPILDEFSNEPDIGEYNAKINFK